MRLVALLLLLAALAPAQDLFHLDVRKEAHQISPAEIAQMENALLSSPHDLSTRARLMSYYFQQSIAQPRIAHVLWVVEHHPESKLAGSPVAGVTRSDLLNTRSDYEAARLLWLRQAESHPASAAVLANAGRFFSAEEPQRAEALLLRAWELDTTDKMRLATLAGFYARAIADCEFQPDLPPASSQCQDTGWIQAVKNRLENIAPVALTRAVANELFRIARSTNAGGAWRDPGFLQRMESRHGKY